MGDDGLVWGVKNGDVSTVQESIGKKVSFGKRTYSIMLSKESIFKNGTPPIPFLAPDVFVRLWEQKVV